MLNDEDLLCIGESVFFLKVQLSTYINSQKRKQSKTATTKRTWGTNFLLAFHGQDGHTGHSHIAIFSLLGKRAFCVTSLRSQTASQPTHGFL